MAVALGQALRSARRKRRLSQADVAKRIGLGRSRYGDLERGKGWRAPFDALFLLGSALDLPLKAEFGRDPLEPPADAGHLDLQELVLRVGRGSGYTGTFELPTRPADPSRSIDAHLLDRGGRRLVVTECWNTIGDLGSSVRTSDRKLADAAAAAVAFSSDEVPLAAGLVWVVRDTKSNRVLFAKYGALIDSKFTGSSSAWLRALTTDVQPPSEPGVGWADVRATRLFARRRPARQESD